MSSVLIAIINMYVLYHLKVTDNYQVVEAKEPKAIIGVEGEDARKDSRYV